MATSTASYEKRISELETILRYPGCGERQIAEYQEIEKRERIQEEKRREGVLRAAEAQQHQMQQRDAYLCELVKSGRLRILVNGARLKSMTTPGISCSKCKQILPETITTLYALHEQLAFCGDDGESIQRARAMFSTRGISCTCGEHNLIQMQVVLID